MSFHKRMRPFAPDRLKITDGFWGAWLNTLATTGLQHQHRMLVETGRFANFLRVSGKDEGPFEGFRFNDSDVYKWQEATVRTLRHRPNAELLSQYHESVKIVADAQMEDGYINSFLQNGQIENRLRNLNALHEMYCIGHLIEAGVAAKICIGDDALLAIARKSADFLLNTYGPDKCLGFCGHEEVELALIKLADCVGDQRYRELAHWMIEERGRRPSIFEAELNDAEIVALSPWAGTLLTVGGKYSGEYAQDHLPIREHASVVGHAVRAMYLYIAATDLADDKNDSDLESALQACWESLTKRRMYITGGIGPSGANEGFTHDYDLPNHSAYAETCAAIGLALWGQAMLEHTANGEYAEIIERALYNGALSGMSLDGTTFFYDNPLESRGNHLRTPWFPCACCPPNIARLIASIDALGVSIAENSVFIHMPIGFEAKARFNGVNVDISLVGNYPWSGNFEISVSPESPVEFEVCVRIPDWTDETNFEVAGADEEAEYRFGYAVLKRTWKAGDKIKVEFEMSPRWMESHPMVRDNAGRLALTNGPLVYCLEEVDAKFPPQLFMVDPAFESVAASTKDLGNAVSMTIEGIAESNEFPDDLYSPEGTVETSSASAQMIPYYAWNNRGRTNMQVWLRRL